jgi:serine phosphatase RsbU (regulator of sigma subunit)
LIVLLIPLLGSEVFFHYRQYVRNQATVLAEQGQVASSLAGDTSVFVARAVAVERSIGRAMVTAHWPSSTAERTYISSALDSIPTLRRISFANADGIVTEGSWPAVIGLSISDRSYFKQLRAGASWRVSDVLMTRTSHTVEVVIATAIRDHNGKFHGVVSAVVNERGLLSALRAQPSPQTELVLVDPRGFVSFTSDSRHLSYTERNWSAYPFVASALHGKIQYIDRFKLPGRPVMMGAMAPVTMLGWAAGAFVPRNQTLDLVRRAALRDLLVTFAILVLTFILGSVLARQMIYPVEQLSDVAETLGHGDLSARARIPNTEEFATLATTMNRMAELIQQRDQALREAYERERLISVTLQEAMLPSAPERVGNIEIAIGYFPALQEAEIGGDFYDVMTLPGGLVGLVIADVSGKGLSAAVRTAMVRYMIEGFAYEHPDPAHVLQRVNAAVYGYGQEWTFVTAFFGIIDPATGELNYANAGHPPPMLRRRDGNVEQLAASAGLPLGVADDAVYRARSITLLTDDALICFTDGVEEARHGGNWFGEEGLISALGPTDGTPNDMVRRVYDAVRDFTSGQPQDDIALLAIRLHATSETSP